MVRQIFKLNVLILLIFLAMLFSNVLALAGTSHGVNGYVDSCGSGFDVNNANVTFFLVDSNGSLRTNMSLNDIVGVNGKSGKSGWYSIDVGNFDVQWLKGNVVMIFIYKDGYNASSYAILTEAGNDQAFTVCLGPEMNFSCACGNAVCEYWLPLCETSETCPQDCNCSCPDGICQPECGENAANCEDCPAGYCGDGLCQFDIGENSMTCCSDCRTCELNGRCDFGESYICCADCAFYCGNTKCEAEYNETPENCPSDCGMPGQDGKPVCGDGICDVAFGETWQNCSVDCLSELSVCGDGKCAGPENSTNCCLDCGCQPPEGCLHFKCISNKCQEVCCLFGYCCVWLGLCWYWFIAIIIAAIAAFLAYALTRKNLTKIAKELGSIIKLKMIAFTEKARLYEK